MKPFIILSLPRSRTAWLSEFLQSPRMECQHEPFVKHGSLKSLRKWFRDAPEGVNRGIAEPSLSIESGAAFEMLEWMRERVGKPQVVFVWRDVESVFNSMQKAGFPDCEKELISDAHENLLMVAEKLDREALHFDFEDLEHGDIAGWIWGHCGGAEINYRERFERMRTLNIQVRGASLIPSEEQSERFMAIHAELWQNAVERQKKARAV